MATPRSKARDIALEVCKEFPNTATRTLARKLRNEYPVHFANTEVARSFIRDVRGLRGSKRRSSAELPKEKQKDPKPHKIPPSLAEPFLSFEVTDAKNVGIISDLHIPFHSDQACDAAIKKLKWHKCDTIIINGDCTDFYSISRYERDPGLRDLAMELKMAIEGLQAIRSNFPKARIVYKLGNHEERWDLFIWNRAPELYNVESCRIHELLKLPSMGIEVVSDQRPILVGNLPILHGHELQKGISAPVNPARGAFLRTMHTVAVGHHHRTSTHVELNMWGSEVAVWSIGCLSAPNPGYNRFGKSNHGFAFVEVHSDGEFDFINYRISKDWKVRAT